MLDLTTPSLLFSAISFDIVGLYESLPFIRQRSACLERKASANPWPQGYRPDSEPAEKALSDPFHANIRNTQFAALRDRYVLHLCIVAGFRRMDIWHSLLLLAASLCVCIWEINISVKALEIHLEDISSKEKLKQWVALNFPSKCFASSERSSIFALAIGKSLS